MDEVEKKLADGMAAIERKRAQQEANRAARVANYVADAPHLICIEVDRATSEGLSCMSDLSRFTIRIDSDEVDIDKVVPALNAAYPTWHFELRLHSVSTIGGDAIICMKKPHK
jgi:hypothetical protein